MPRLGRSRPARAYLYLGRPAPPSGSGQAVSLPVATATLAAPLLTATAGATVALPVATSALAAPLVAAAASGGPPSLEAGSSYATTGGSVTTAEFVR